MGYLAKKKERPEDDDALESTTAKWRDSMAFQIYEMTKQGVSENKQAKILGTYPPTFNKWKTTKRLLRLALKAAKKYTEVTKVAVSERRALYQALPPELQDTWDSLCAVENEKNSLRKLEYILRDKGEKARQHLFFHALVEFNFNVNRAMKVCMLSSTQLRAWVANNPAFVELVQEIKFLKGNFFEGALVDACQRGDTGAIVFANRTFNRDRGYNDKIEMDVNQTNINSNISLADLNLSLACRKEILKAIRDHKAKPITQPKLITQKVG